MFAKLVPVLESTSRLSDGGSREPSGILNRRVEFRLAKHRQLDAA